MLLVLVCAIPAQAAEQMRLAFWHTELQRDGPGLLLRDIQRGGDAQIDAVRAVLAHADADIVLLQGVDWDADLRTARALADVLDLGYTHIFAPRPNTGRPSGFDLNGNGRLGDPEDAIGFGEFTGQGGLVLLSRLPILQDAALDLSGLPWGALPEALLPYDGQPDGLADGLPLSAIGHWIVPLQRPDGTTFHIGGFAANPPVFDGPEDRNGRRNHDQIMIWQHLLDGTLPGHTDPTPMALMGNANLDPDPDRGEGRKDAIRSLLRHPAVQDPAPAGHRGTATVDWSERGPGQLRTSYILPPAQWHVTGSGLVWPAEDDPLANAVRAASRHRLIWVDVIPAP